MRSPGVIYRKYRQLKRKLIYDKLVESRKVTHKNCHYGKYLIREDDHGNKKVVHLCSFNSTSKDRIEICTKPLECNAFANKWTKEIIISEFEKILEDPKLKAELFPELTAYEWVLDKSLKEAKKKPGLIVSFIIFLISTLEKVIKTTGDNKETLH